MEMMATPTRSGQGVIRTSPKRVAHTFTTSGWTGEATNETRVVCSMFDDEDIRRFLDIGYLLVPNVLDPAFVQGLRAALERCRQEDFGDSRESGSPPDSHFQGQYVLDVLFRDPVMARLLEPEPIIDTVRSLLGPCVAVYSCTGLVCYPGAIRSGTDWHSDYLVTMSPSPPMPTVTPRVVCIVYLDDLSLDGGPTYVVPGSHRFRRLPDWQPEIDPPSEALLPTAGSVLFYDAALWHRGGRMGDPTRSRRSIIFTLVAGGHRLFRELPTCPPPGTFRRELLDCAERDGNQGLLELMSRQWYG